MKQILFLGLCIVMLANSARAEPINLDCTLDDGRALSFSYDNAGGQIGLVTATSVYTIPVITSNGEIVLAYWITPDGKQLQSISFAMASGEVQIARVGTKEPLLQYGHCTRRS